MSCQTRSQLETTMNDAFSDLIENTALACEQIDTEQKHNLWLMGGIIDFTHSAGTNTLSWKEGPYATNINKGSLSFNSALSDNAIDITYPTEFYNPGVVHSLPISCQISANTTFMRHQKETNYGGYKFSIDTSTEKITIHALRRTQLSAYIACVGGTWTFNGKGYTPASYLSSQITGSYGSGVATFTTDFELEGIPIITPYPINPGTPPTMYTPFSEYVDANTFKVYFWDNVNGSLYTGSPSGLAFNASFGAVDLSLNMETTDFGTGASISILGIFQKVVE